MQNRGGGVTRRSAAESLGYRLRAILEARGLSQRDVEEALGLSYSIVAHWERGTASPRLLYACDLADLYRVTVDDLLRGSLARILGESPEARVVRVASERIERRRERMRSQVRSRYQSRKRDGVCTLCGGTLDRPRVTCSICEAARVLRYRDRKAGRRAC